MMEIDKMIKRFGELGQKVTKAFGTMREKREKIKAQAAEILLEIKKLQTVQDELEAARTTQNDIAVDIAKYSNYKSTKQVSSTKMVDTQDHNTLCMKHTNVRFLLLDILCFHHTSTLLKRCA